MYKIIYFIYLKSTWQRAMNTMRTHQYEAGEVTYEVDFKETVTHVEMIDY